MCIICQGANTARNHTYHARPSARPVVFSTFMYAVLVVGTVSGGHWMDCLPCDAGVPRRVVCLCVGWES